MMSTGSIGRFPRRIAMLAAASALALASATALAQAQRPNPSIMRVFSNGDARGAAPSRVGGFFVYSDGTHVRATDPSGRAGHVGSDGTIRYDDGTRVSHDPKTGVTIVDRPDGSRVVTNPNGPQDVGGRYQWADGFRTRGTDPQGRPGHINPDGSVSFADGTRVSHDPLSGDTKVVNPDGTVDLQRGSDRTAPDSSGAIGVDGNGNLMWRDGFGVPARDPNGGEGHEIGGGWIGFSDGTMVSHDVDSGDTKIVHPDGTVEFNNARTGSHSETPPWENGISTPSGTATSGSAGNQNGAGTTSAQPKPEKTTTGNGNQNTGGSNQNPSGGSTDTTKPDKEKPDKPDKGKGMIVNGDGAGGNGSVGGAGGMPVLGSSRRLPGLFGATPTPDDAPARPTGQPGAGATPQMVSPRAFGPGQRAGETGTRATRGTRINVGSFVIDPDPNAQRSGGVRRIDPFGGRR